MRDTGSPPEPRPRPERQGSSRPSAIGAAAGNDPAPGEAGRPAGLGTLAREPEFAWLVLWLVCMVAIVAFPAWQVVPADTIWASLALLYGFWLWPSHRGLAAAAPAALVIAAAAYDEFVVTHPGLADSAAGYLPLLAMLLVTMTWQANRKLTARERADVAAEARRLIVVQRQFLQDAAHQLRTPITIALGHAELLAGELPASRRGDMRVVVGELQRLKALSDRLLLVAASENPGFLRREPADLDEIAAELILRWQPVAPRRWRLGPLAPVRASVDAERLGMALDALVENAVRHTTAGDEIAISVRGPDEGGRAAVTVTDTGEGIAADDLPRIFDRFHTAAGGTARGTGLGLALVQAIARGHDGEVTVRSAPGTGSRFSLLIPALGAPGVPAREPSPLDPPIREGGHVAPGARRRVPALPARRRALALGHRGRRTCRELQSWAVSLPRRNGAP